MKYFKKNPDLKKHHLYALVISLVSLALFFEILKAVINDGFIIKLDIFINQNITTLWNPALNKIMIFITSIANTLPLLVISILLFGILIYKKKFYNSALLVVGLISGLASELIIKSIIHRVRPTNSLINLGSGLFGSSYSFPSGHATMSTIFFALVLYSFKDEIKNKLAKYLFIAINILLFLLIGFSRTYLSVHWFSDVLAGFALGLFWLTFWILVLSFIKFKEDR